MKEFFRIPHQTISREDVKVFFPRADNLTDKRMQEISNQMGKWLINDAWWNVLEEAIKAVME